MDAAIAPSGEEHRDAGDGDAGAVLELRFTAEPETIQGVLAVAQDWAAARGLGRANQGALRLVLEELLLNIAFHAYPRGGMPPPAGPLPERGVELSMGPHPFFREGEEAEAPGRGDRRLYLQIRDAGRPFNPLSYVPLPVGSSASGTVPGGKGLFFVRLLAAHMVYSRAEGQNILSLALSLDEEEDGETRAPEAAPAPPGAGARRLLGLPGALPALWRSSLALKQTAFLTLTVLIILWAGILLFYRAVNAGREEAARVLGRQVMQTLAPAGAQLFGRLASGVEAIADGLGRRGVKEDDLENLPLMSDTEKELVTALLAEKTVRGVVYSERRRFREWLLKRTDGVLLQSPLSVTFTPAWAVRPRRERGPSWQGPVPDMPGDAPDKGAAMFFGLPWQAGEDGRGGIVGVLVGMPEVAAVLKALSGFPRGALVLLNKNGEYLIAPPGGNRTAGAADIFADARQSGRPRLAALGRRMLRGEEGGMAMDSERETVALYAPIPLPGGESDLYLGLLLPARDLGGAPEALPPGMLLLALGGPACFGFLVWRVTSRTLRPLRDLTDSLENMARGDLDSPLPPPGRPDETGHMLRSFERARLALRTALRNLAESTTAQERLANELAVARAIQESMLSKEFPLLRGIEVRARIDMAREVCGDLYDCFAMDLPGGGKRLCCVVGDVSGKGVPAAMLMSSAMSLARAALLEGWEPAQALARVNNALVRNDAASMFVTMLAGVLDPATGVFVWANAGHPPPMLARPDPGGGQSEIMPWTDELALGIRPGREYSSYSRALAPGEALLLYTDGAAEAVSARPGRAGSVFYGEESLALSLARHVGAPGAASLLEGVRRDLFAHMAGAAPHDDITLMAIRRSAPG